MATTPDRVAPVLTADGGGHDAYTWLERWLPIPLGDRGQVGWDHHDLVVTADRRIISFHQDEPLLLVYDPNGSLESAVRVEVTEGHGMTLVRDPDGGESLWIADNGVKRRINPDGSVRVDPGPWGGQAVQVTLEGFVLRRLVTPPLAVYESGRYGPSSIAIDEERLGGTGDIWVSDGYGQSLVHRYDRHGVYIGTLSGEEGAGRFDCPHGIFIDRRRSEPELYIGDRSNGRVQVYDLEGAYQRVFGEDFLTAPCSFAVSGDSMLIPELCARLTVCDAADRLVLHLGDDQTAPKRPGWPNDEIDGRTVPATCLVPGRFNSPHGIAVDPDGAVYVSEWLLGGRCTKLVPSPRRIDV